MAASFLAVTIAPYSRLSRANRDFLNLWEFPGFEKICHAIPRCVKEQEFKRLVEKLKG